MEMKKTKFDNSNLCLVCIPDGTKQVTHQQLGNIDLEVNSLFVPNGCEEIYENALDCYPNIKDLWIPLSLCRLSAQTLRSLKMLKNIIIHNSTNEKLPDRFMPSLPEAIYDKKNVYDTLKSFSYSKNIKFYFASNDNI